MTDMQKNIYSFVLLLISIALVLYGVFGLALKENGLLAPRLTKQSHLQTMVQTQFSEVFSHELVLPKTMTWDQIRIERDLSQELIVESQACTSGMARKSFADIQNTAVNAGTKIQFVFKAGACPGRK